MSWLVASLAALAGLFYGLWQRSRARRFRVEWQRTMEAVEVLQAERRDEVRRHEALVASLKADIARLEDEALANATPDALRRRLAQLLGASTKNRGP